MWGVVRLWSDWRTGRNPYLNDELREWVALTSPRWASRTWRSTLRPRPDRTRSGACWSRRRWACWTRGTRRAVDARFSLSVRLYPWHAVHGVDLRRRDLPAVGARAPEPMAPPPEPPRPGHHGRHARARAGAGRVRRRLLADGRASELGRPPRAGSEDAVPAFLGRAPRPTAARSRSESTTQATRPATPPPLRQPPRQSRGSRRAYGGISAGRPTQSPLQAEDTVMELERRLGLRGRKPDQTISIASPKLRTDIPRPALCGRRRAACPRAWYGVALPHPGLHEGGDQQQQRAARQVEVGDQRVDRAERVRRRDVERTPAAGRLCHARGSRARAWSSCQPPRPGRRGAAPPAWRAPWRVGSRTTRGGSGARR